MSEQDSTCALAENPPWFDWWAPAYTRWEGFYCDVQLSDLKSQPAVYVVIGDGVVQYIGSSRNLRARMSGRMPVLYMAPRVEDWYVKTIWGRFSDFELKVSYTKKYGEWLMRELRLIRRLRPVFNCEGDGGQGRRIDRRLWWR